MRAEFSNKYPGSDLEMFAKMVKSANEKITAQKLRMYNITEEPGQFEIEASWEIKPEQEEEKVVLHKHKQQNEKLKEKTETNENHRKIVKNPFKQKLRQSLGHLA